MHGGFWVETEREGEVLNIPVLLGGLIAAESTRGGGECRSRGAMSFNVEGKEGGWHHLVDKTSNYRHILES